MSKKSDGGQAFPFVTDDDKAEHLTVEWGMSLRDWFAGMALSGIKLTANEPMKTDSDVLGVAALVSKLAYAISDAMLNERNK